MTTLLLTTAFSAHLQLKEALNDGAPADVKAIGEISDLYVHEGQKMRFRVPGGLHEFGDVVTPEDFQETFGRLIRDFEDRLGQTGRVEDAYDLPIAYTTFSADDGDPVPTLVESFTRVRMTVYQHARGQSRAAVVRFSPASPLPLHELNLEPIARGLLDDLRGAILVTGQTHSGKTYTMSSMVDFINKTREGHIVTIEDPIEIPIEPDKCVVSQLEIGIDVRSFASGVNGSLRQSPVAVMVGEIRDTETARASMRVVQGGHFLLAGLHGPDALGALRAFCSFLDPNRLDEERSQLAQRLNGVIYQALVRSVDGRSYFVACEVISFLQNDALRGKLANGDFESIAAALEAGEGGTLSLNRSLLRLVKEKKVRYEDAKKATYDAKGFHAMHSKLNASAAS